MTDRTPSPSLFGEIRIACAEVMARARFVEVDDARLADLALELADAEVAPAQLDPAHHHLGDPSATLAYVFCLDAINFGSGWFPFMTKRPGCSGYFTVATSLKEHFEAGGPLSCRGLREMDAAECARIFGQDLVQPEMAELMHLFARALRDLGDWLDAGFGGRFEAVIDAAAQSAASLVGMLARMPFYADVHRYGSLRVPFYKRAQITCADLSLAFGGSGPGEFRDLESLTVFADNLVPHVLRRLGVLRYAPELLERIAAGELLEVGSAEEIEIRAAAVDAVERMCARLHAEGCALSAQALDHRLWNRGQSSSIKDQPRHRARCVYY